MWALSSHFKNKPPIIMNWWTACCISSITVAFHLIATYYISIFISSIATEVLQFLQLLQQSHFFNCYLLYFIFHFLQLLLLHFISSIVIAFHFHFLQVLLLQFISSIAIAFLFFYVVHSVLFGEWVFAFSSTWKIWFPHIPKKKRRIYVKK